MADKVVKSTSLYNNVIASSPEFVGARVEEDYALVEELDRALAPVRGQDYAVQAVKEYLFGINGRKNAHGVGGLLTFIGPSAVGKTYMAELIGGALRRPCLRLDMSSYNDHEASLSELFGIHPSYKSAAAGFLTGYVLEHPVCVLILDDFEKAHNNVQSRFFQILERGEVQDSFTGDFVSFRDVIVVITSNAGKSLYEKPLTTYLLSTTPQSTVVKALKSDEDPRTGQPYFSEALVSRLSMGRIILFNKLRPEVLHAAIAEEIAQCISYYDEKYSIAIRVDRDRFADLVLFNQGERADIRTAKKAVNEFFARNIERMVKAKRELGTPFFTELHCEIDLSDASESAREVFFGTGKSRVLVCCREEKEDFFRSLVPEKTEIVFAKEGYDLKSVGTEGFSAAILDIKEELKRFSGQLFPALTTQNEFPVYVYDTAAKTGAVFDDYTDRGASGCNFHAGKRLPLEEWAREILENLGLTSICGMLFRANKIVEFETKWRFDDASHTATLSVGQLRVSIAKEAADEEKFSADRTIPNVRFSDIYGAKDAKEELGRIIRVLKEHDMYRRSGIRPPRGILLDGAPGTGKTMLAKALAAEAGLPFMQRNAASFIDKLAGEGAKAIRETFSVARRYAPCILFIDEIDAIARARTVSDGGTTEILNALLSEMDGFSDTSAYPVFLVAATNFNTQKGETVLDEAFLRRFDRKIRIELPDLETRTAYLTDTLSRYGCEVSPRTAESVAKRSVGWSLAELDLVVQNAVREGTDRRTAVSDEMLVEAFERYADGENKEYDEEKMRRIAIHEAGHAVAAVLLGITPSYTTIRARGDYGGYVYYADEKVTDLSRADLLARICISLAGRVGEVAFYGEDGVRSDASSDLRAATEYASRYVCDYAMDEGFLLWIDRSKELPTEAKTRIADVVKGEYAHARELIGANKEAVKRVADVLLEKISLDGTELTPLVREVNNG